MTRRKLLSAIVALIAMTAAMLVSDTRTASAQQNPNCCIYSLDVGGIGANCFPILYWIRWGNVVFGPNTVNSNSAPGPPFVFLIPGGCPPAATFNGISLTGPNGPFATYNNPVQFNVNNCCIVARITYDVNGCPLIYLRPC